jgi:phosphatidate cytidylyltransferase
MLRWRLLLGTLLVAAIIGLGWLDARASVPGIWLVPIALGVALLSGQEMLELVTPTGIQFSSWPVHGGNLLLVLAAWIPVAFDWPAGPYLTTALFAAIWLIFLVAVGQYQGPGGNAGRLAAAVLAVVYVGFFLAFAVALRMDWGVGALASLVVVVKMGDTGAYTVGRLIGRHKMAPKLSPGKTLEGAAGALAFAALGSWVTFTLLDWLAGPAHIPTVWWKRLGFGLLVGAAGMFGDLAESFLKRDAGVKDSSRWMPGFGGVLDIVDSILLAAPVAWACWQFGLVFSGGHCRP